MVITRPFLSGFLYLVNFTKNWSHNQILKFLPKIHHVTNSNCGHDQILVILTKNWSRDQFQWSSWPNFGKNYQHLVKFTKIWSRWQLELVVSPIFGKNYQMFFRHFCFVVVSTFIKISWSFQNMFFSHQSMLFAGLGTYKNRKNISKWLLWLKWVILFKLKEICLFFGWQKDEHFVGVWSGVDLTSNLYFPLLGISVNSFSSTRSCGILSHTLCWNDLTEVNHCHHLLGNMDDSKMVLETFVCTDLVTSSYCMTSLAHPCL